MIATTIQDKQKPWACRSKFRGPVSLRTLYRSCRSNKWPLLILTALTAILVLLPLAPFLAQEPLAQSPLIESLSPSSGPVLSILKIKGSGFSLSSSENAVTIGNFIAASRTLSQSEIEFIVPDGLAPGNSIVTVTTRGLASNPVKFTVTDAATPDVLAALNVTFDLSSTSYLGTALPRSSVQTRASSGGDTIFPGSLSHARGIFPPHFLESFSFTSFGIGSGSIRSSLYATPVPGRSGIVKDTPVRDLTASALPVSLIGATSNGLVSITGSQVNFTPLPLDSGAVVYTPTFVPNPNFDARLASGPSNPLLLPGVVLLTSSGLARIVGGIPYFVPFPAEAGNAVTPPVAERNPNFSIAPGIIGSPNPFLSSTLIVTSRGLVRITDSSASFIPFPPGVGRPIGSPVFQCNPNFNPGFGSGFPGSNLGEPFPFRSDLLVPTANGLITISGKTATFTPVPAAAGRVLSQPVCQINPNFSVFLPPSLSLNAVRFYQSGILLSTENGLVVVDGSSLDFIAVPQQAGRVIGPPIFGLNPTFNPFYPASPTSGSPRPFLETILLSTTEGIAEISGGKARFTAVPLEAGQVISPPILELNGEFNPNFNPVTPTGSPFPFAEDVLVGTTNGLVRVSVEWSSTGAGAIASSQGADTVGAEAGIEFIPQPQGAGMAVASPIPVTTPGGSREILLAMTNGLVSIIGNSVEFIPLPDGASQVLGPPTIAPSGDVFLAVANGLVQVSSGKANFSPLPPQAGQVISLPTFDPNSAPGASIVLATTNGFALISGKLVQLLPLPQGAGQNIAPRILLSSALRPNQAPTAEAGPNQIVNAGTSVTLDGSASTDPDGTIVSYLWDFGDGATASGQIVSHTYFTTGVFTVTLTVTDDAGAAASDTTKITVIDITSPTVKLQAPVGGETIPAGSSLTVRWVSYDNVGVISHDILLATDGVNFNTSIASGLSGFAQEFNWFVPTALVTSSARIRIIARDAAGNAGWADSGLFAIRDTQPPSVTIQSPLGGEILSTGSAFYIRWVSFDNIAVASHDIVLATDGFNFNFTVASGLSGFTQELKWSVPTTLVTSAARLRVIARDPSGNVGQGESGFFTIRDTIAPTVTVTAPFSGQVISSGSTFAIRWKSYDNISVISHDIVLSTDGGFSFQSTIAFGLGGDQTTFFWPVPTNLATSSAVIRVIARDAAGNGGQGDSGIVTIRDTEPPSVTVTAPKTGQIVNPGLVFTIAWNSSDNVGVISHDILLSTNGGRSFPTTIISGLGGGVQSFNWNVPASLSTFQARIRVRAYDAAGNAGFDDTGNFSILDNTPPTVNVTSPHTGQTINPGAVFTIQWFSSDNVDVISHEIQFSSNGGKTFSTIAAGLGGNVQQFDWPVPIIDTTQARLRVLARDAAGNQGFGETGNFTIRDTLPPTVKVLAPTSGQMVAPGSVLTIQWKSSDNLGVVSHEIRFSTNGGFSYPTVIVSGLSGSQQSFDWPVPTNINTTRASIRVIGLDAQGNAGQGDSGIFTIRDTVPPTVSLLAPVGGEVLPQGSPFTIRWTSSDDIGLASHDILLSVNAGSSFASIVTGLGGSQQWFNWTVPSDVVTNQAQIRVVARDFGGNTAQATSGNFSIVDATPPTVTVLRPLAGEVFNAGSLLQIRWRSSDNIAVTSHNIVLSIDGGVTFPTPIATNISGSQQLFNWTIPSSLSSNQAVIRVIARDAAGNPGQGNSGVFTIRQLPSPPTVRVTSPNGGEVITAGSTFNIQWTSSDDKGIVSHDILLSINAGQNFNITIQAGLPGSAQSFAWSVPSDLSTNQGRVRVIARDTDGLTGQDESDANFTIRREVPPGTGLALVAARDITIIGGLPSSGSILGSISTTGDSREVAVAPNGTYALVLERRRYVSVITNLDKPGAEARVLEVGNGPAGVAISQDSSFAVVVNGVDNPPTLSIITGLPNSPTVSTVPVPYSRLGQAQDIALSPSGNTAVITSPAGALIVDGVRPGGSLTARGFFPVMSLAGVAVAPDGDTAFAARMTASQVVIIKGLSPGHTPSLVPEPVDTGRVPRAVRLTPDGRTLVVTNFTSNTVSIFRVVGTNLTPITTLAVGSGPAGLSISFDGTMALVANSGDRTLTVITDLNGSPRVVSPRIGPAIELLTDIDAEQSVAFIPR